MKTHSKKISYAKATSLKFLESGEEYFAALLELIQNAQKLIYLQVYTLDPDSGYLCTYSKDTKLVQGSGHAYAASAMGLRRNAIQAVKHAMKFDVYSGGNVQWVEI